MAKSRKPDDTPQDGGHEAAVPADVRPPAQVSLDSSNAGAPFIPAQAAAVGGVAAAPGPPATPTGELIVEVEFAAGTDAIGTALTGNMTAFLAGTSGAAPPNSAL